MTVTPNYSFPAYKNRLFVKLFDCQKWKKDYLGQLCSQRISLFSKKWNSPRSDSSSRIQICSPCILPWCFPGLTTRASLCHNCVEDIDVFVGIVLRQNLFTSRLEQACGSDAFRIRHGVTTHSGRIFIMLRYSIEYSGGSIWLLFAPLFKAFCEVFVPGRVIRDMIIAR